MKKKKIFIACDTKNQNVIRKIISHTKTNKLVVSNDEVLSIISLYWFTETATSSARLYKENGEIGFSFNKIIQPMAGAIFKKDIMIPPRAWAEESYDLRHWTVMNEGGHFAALEKPELYLEDLRIFFRLLR